ncbi:MAG: cell division protein FtsL [Lachnospiraceae bacterium]|nr:cell division protein FtsL [Lachnospiraceae bacterium]
MARGNNTYVYGNTARALRPIEQEVRSPRRLSTKSRKNIKRDSAMNPGFMIFMTLAMVLTGIVCVQYIRLQSSLTTYVNTISAMEIELQSLRAENDDYESRIKGAIGLENIKKRAMDDLGMTYASDDQIVTYNSDGTDYVRQFVSLQ